MSSNTQTEAREDTPLRCIDCGVPVEQTFGGIPICEDCLTTRGSCCQEFGSSDLTKDEAPREYASPACSAHEFEDTEK